MKKFLLLCAKTGFVFLFIGILLTIIGFKSFETKFQNWSDFPLIHHIKTTPMKVSKSDLSITDIETIKNISLEIPIGSLTIKQGDNLSLELGNKVAEYIYLEQDNTTLLLKSTVDKNSWRLLQNNLSNDEEFEISLVLPYNNLTLDTFTITMGYGEAVVSSIDCETFAFSIKAGEIKTDSITAQSMQFSIGAGEFTGNDLFTTENFSLDSGAGSVSLAGDLKGNVSIAGGVGETDITLYSNKNNYNISASTGLGDLKIDDNTVSAIGGHYSENNNAVNTLNITCGIGEINVDFNE